LYRNKIIPLLILGTMPQNHTIHDPQPGTADSTFDPSDWLPLNDGLSFDSPSMFAQPLAPL
jgi:hypothetical protein